jgi:two-component system, OmpR family, response regulator
VTDRAPRYRLRVEPNLPRVEALTVFLVEDDVRLSALTARYLESHGNVVLCFAHAEGVIPQLRLRPPDAVLLDLNLSGVDGVEVCRRIRAISTVPILMITARDAEADRVLGLESGADDYVIKPFSPRELLARLRAQVRRARGRSGPEAERVCVGPLVLDPASRGVTLDGRNVALTTQEFELLLALARSAGRVLSREQLMSLYRGAADEAFDRAVDVSVSRLRAKLGDDPRNPRFLKTVRNAGYMLARDDDRGAR